MAFATQGSTPSNDGDSKTVDFDELNAYVIETAGLQERETLVGYVSMLVDLGMQELPDAEVPFTGSEEDERRIIAEQPDTYFKNVYDYDKKQDVYCKCWPQKPQQCIAFAVDFPDIIIDKGQFFGESKPLPLRLWMGGQFYTPSHGMVVGRPTPLKFTNLDKSRKTKVWSLAQNSLPYKMAVAAKIVKPGEPFLPSRVDELLGKAFQFSAQVWMKPGKQDKEYYTEYVSFVGALGRGQVVPEQPTEPMMIQFGETNPEAAVKELRAHVVNTIKRASNYEGSVLQKQIESLRGQKPKQDDADDAGDDQADQKPAEKPARKPREKKEPVKKEPAPQPAPDYDSFDQDIPFANPYRGVRSLMV